MNFLSGVLPVARGNVGDLVRYGFGPTALMRVTDIIGGRHYGRAFHSTGTCTSRSEVFEPSAEDRECWRLCHDADDQWVRGAWGAASVGRNPEGEDREDGLRAEHEHAVPKADAHTQSAIK